MKLIFLMLLSTAHAELPTSVDISSETVTDKQIATNLEYLDMKTNKAQTDLKEAGVKGWISFSGAGTIAIKDSYNVDSITDNGVGDYTITWKTPFKNANYAISGVARYHEGTDNGAYVVLGANPTTTTTRIFIVDAAGTGTWDCPWITLIAVGEQ